MHTEKGNGEHPPEEPLRPGVSNEFLRRHGIRHVNDSEAEVLIGRRQSGLAIPYRSITDPELKVNGRHFHRIRVDRSTDKMKYLSPTGCGVQLYIPQDITLGPELVIAEGEFKCLAAAEEGISAVGIGGICSMMPGGELLPELRTILSEHRDVEGTFLHSKSAHVLKRSKVLIPSWMPAAPVYA